MKSRCDANSSKIVQHFSEHHFDVNKGSPSKHPNIKGTSIFERRHRIENYHWWVQFEMRLNPISSESESESESGEYLDTISDGSSSESESKGESESESESSSTMDSESSGS